MSVNKFHVFIISLFVLVTFNVQAEQQISFDDIKQQAEQGDALAQAKMGALYHLGADAQLPANARFVIKTNFKAVEYLLAGIEQNDKKATEWMLKAAKQGLVEAEMFMAASYDRGLGVSQTPRKATDFYKKAKANGNTTAEAIMGRYEGTRLMASKAIPFEYALKILTKK